MAQEEPRTAAGGVLLLPVTCPGCSEDFDVELRDLWGGKPTHRTVPRWKADYASLKAVVGHYQKVKGYEFKTWWSSHGPRAMRAAKRILHFLRKTQDPVGNACLLIEETGRDLDRKGLEWQLETCFTRSAGWLAEKQNAKGT